MIEAIRNNRDEWLYLQEELRRKQRQLATAQARIMALEEAIETVLADGESQHPGGWGPDVTMLNVLRRALEPGQEERG